MTNTTFNRQIFYAVTSFLLGVWAFVKVNSISGPAFEPILAACMNADIAIDEFASKTGYHTYEPRVGLGAFNALVCLITQFLFELRQTYPAGVLVWGGVFVVALPATALGTLGAGRAGRGPIRYPVIMGLLAQLFGISVIYPLICVPSFIFGEIKPSAPLTSFRIIMAALLTLPGIILTVIVFTASTDSYLWTVSAGMLGGPILALFSLGLWKDSSKIVPTTVQSMQTTLRSVKTLYRLLALVGFFGWYYLVAIACSYYDTVGDLWNSIWVNANSSVAFMTIDTGVLYLGLLLFISFQSESKALKALFLTLILGPATAICLTFAELEDEVTMKSIAELAAKDDGKKDK